MGFPHSLISSPFFFRPPTLGNRVDFLLCETLIHEVVAGASQPQPRMVGCMVPPTPNKRLHTVLRLISTVHM